MGVPVTRKNILWGPNMAHWETDRVLHHWGCDFSLNPGIWQNMLKYEYVLTGEDFSNTMQCVIIPTCWTVQPQVKISNGKILGKTGREQFQSCALGQHLHWTAFVHAPRPISIVYASGSFTGPQNCGGVGWGNNVHLLAHFYDVTPRHVHLHLRTYILEKASARVKEKNLS